MVMVGWHGVGRLFLHSPQSGSRPGVKACLDPGLKSGSYLTQNGLEELTTECIDQQVNISSNTVVSVYKVNLRK